MHLPAQLQNAIEQEASGHRLEKAVAELSERYRRQSQSIEPLITTDAHRLAYAVVRMPATFSAALAVLGEVRRLAPDLRTESLLDLGAGTGAALWAAVEIYDSLRQLTLIEQDHQLIELGRKLGQASEHDALRLADWQAANLRMLTKFSPHDLVICSYSLNEIGPAAVSRILKAAWQAAQQALVIIEPGTMKGFETILAARTQLIESGAFLIAPCPHQNGCPLAENDWCHFNARFERSPLHRRLKGGTLGYEDEKFSYVAFSKQPIRAVNARILRHPLRQAGYTKLQLCAPEGLQAVTVTKRDKEAWRRARKADWGDAWDDGSTKQPAE